MYFCDVANGSIDGSEESHTSCIAQRLDMWTYKYTCWTRLRHILDISTGAFQPVWRHFVRRRWFVSWRMIICDVQNQMFVFRLHLMHTRSTCFAFLKRPIKFASTNTHTHNHSTPSPDLVLVVPPRSMRSMCLVWPPFHINELFCFDRHNHTNRNYHRGTTTHQQPCKTAATVQQISIHIF